MTWTITREHALLIVDVRATTASDRDALLEDLQGELHGDGNLRRS